MPRPIHFEIHADDPERAVRFYQDLFGWEFNKWDGPMPYWLIKTGADGQPGINGGMMRRCGLSPAPDCPVAAYVCTVGVDSVDDSVQKLAAAGGSLAHPKMPVPGIGWLAYGKDTEGNVFGMMQHDPAAR